MNAESIIKKVNAQSAVISDANVVAFNLPGIPGIGTVGGFDFRLQDYLSGDLNTFVNYAGQLIAEANQDPRIGLAYTTYAPNYPFVKIDIDRLKTAALGVDLAELFVTLQAYLGSFYINDFNKFGKVFRVYVQADKSFRSEVRDITDLYVVNRQGNIRSCAGWRNHTLAGTADNDWRRILRR